MCFDPRDFNWRHYQRMWTNLNASLNEIRCRDGLAAALKALWAQQFHTGFVVSDPRSTVRWRVRDQAGKHALTVQWNPGRAKRQGGGRDAPPRGEYFINCGCRLCRRNMYLRSGGRQLGYDLVLPRRAWVVAANPFGFAPAHITVALDEHEPQSWRRDSVQDTVAEVESFLTDLVAMAGMLPGWIGLANGPDAGATIPEHRHAQFFERPAGVMQFGLEEAALRGRQETRSMPVVVTADDYPVTALLFHGSAENVLRAATEWMNGWIAHNRNSAALTGNFVAAGHERGEVDLYVVPRSTAFAQAPGIKGLVGGLEVLGEIVISTEEEKRAIESGRMDYIHLSKVLASVEEPGIRRYLEIVP